MRHTRLEYMGRRSGNNWATVHQPAPVHPEDMPDDCNVFDDIADLEESVIEQTNLNLNGKLIMNKTAIALALASKGLTPSSMATHRVPAGTVERVLTGTNFFDPMDTIVDKLERFTPLLSRVSASMAWQLDATIINQARTVLFERWDSVGELDREIEDPFNNFCQRVGDDLNHPELYQDESAERTLALLLGLSPMWHDAAASQHDRDDRRAMYNPKALSQLMIDEKPRFAKGDTISKWQLSAAKSAKKTADAMRANEQAHVKTLADQAKLEERIKLAYDTKLQMQIERYVNRDRMLAVDRVGKNKGLIPTLEIIIDTARKHLIENTRFDMLPLDSQRRLTDYAMSTVSRILDDDVAKIGKIGISEFGNISDGADEAIAALDHAYRTKLSQAAELENVTSQVQLNIDREAKAVALKKDAAAEAKARKAAAAKAKREAKAAQRITTSHASVAM